MRSVRSSLTIGRLAIYPRNSNIRTGKWPRPWPCVFVWFNLETDLMWCDVVSNVCLTIIRMTFAHLTAPFFIKFVVAGWSRQTYLQYLLGEHTSLPHEYSNFGLSPSTTGRWTCNKFSIPHAQASQLIQKKIDKTTHSHPSNPQISMRPTENRFLVGPGPGTATV